MWQVGLLSEMSSCQREQYVFFISWERITTRTSPNGIPRDIYSTYVQA